MRLNGQPTSHLVLSIQMDELNHRSSVVLREHDSSVVLADGTGQWDRKHATTLDSMVHRELKTAEQSELEAAGKLLASIALPQAVSKALRSRMRSEVISLWLDIEPFAAMALPWELLWLEGTTDGFLSLCSGVRFNRQVASNGSIPVAEDLDSILLIASESEQDDEHGALLFGPSERESILNALSSAECRRFKVDQLINPAPEALEFRLAQSSPRIIHVIGHAEEGMTGPFLLVGGKPIYAEELASWISTDTKLLIFSCCGSVPWLEAIAQNWAANGIACVCMTSPLRDETAVAFSRSFYASLAEGKSVDECVAQGRFAIRMAGHEWSSAVLLASPIKAEPAAVNPFLAPRVENDHRPFIGREKELNKIKSWFLDDRARLVTITGMGGMGKTRLGMKLATDLREYYSDDIAVVRCEDLTTRSELLTAVSASLGLESICEERDILEALQTKESLVFFDCFEGIVDQAPILEAILTRCPSVQILVTSRILLNVGSEREHILEGLASSARGRNRDALSLFEFTARQVVPGFAVTARNRSQVSELVDVLEAVPLAIILAATQLRHMGLPELIERVQQSQLNNLQKTGPDLGKHSSLYRVISDSFSLLEEESRRAIHLLSVFNGGFNLGDAEFVLAREFTVKPSVFLLRENSILTSRVVDGYMRYRPLDSIREYTELEFDAAHLEPLRPLHAERFAILAEELAERYSNGEWPHVNRHLAINFPNLRSAIEWASRENAHELTCRFARSLARLLFEAGAIELFDLLAAATTIAAQRLQDLELLVDLKGIEGEVRRRQGDPEGAIRVWMEQAELARSRGDIALVHEVWIEVADVAVQSGDVQLAARLVEQAAGLESKEITEVYRVCETLIRARIEIGRGEINRALEFAHQVHSILDHFDGDQSIYYVLLTLSVLYRLAGDYGQAIKSATQLVREAVAGMQQQPVGKGLLELAESYAEAGNAISAVEAFVIANRIPASASKPVREACKARRRSYLELVGEDEFAELVAKWSADPWMDAAANFVRQRV